MALVNDSQYSGQSAIQDVRLLRSNLDRVVRLPFGCMDVVARGNTIYGFAADGHLVMISTDESSPRAYQLNMGIDKVYGDRRWRCHSGQRRRDLHGGPGGRPLIRNNL